MSTGVEQQMARTRYIIIAITRTSLISVAVLSVAMSVLTVAIRYKLNRTPEGWFYTVRGDSQRSDWLQLCQLCSSSSSSSLL